MKLADYEKLYHPEEEWCLQEQEGSAKNTVSYSQSIIIEVLQQSTTI
jgi:hypothetical protein